MVKVLSLLPMLVLGGLAGCSSHGEDVAKASEELAQCLLAGKASCVAIMDDGTQLVTSRATMFYTNDSIRVEGIVKTISECMWYGKVAGNTRNTRVTIGDFIVKMYGEEREDAIKSACEQTSPPFGVSVTVAKAD